MTDARLADRLPPAWRDQATAIAEDIAAAETAWGRGLEQAKFVDYLLERLPESPCVLCIGDLYLACLCAHGQPSAVKAFKERYQSVFSTTFAKLNLEASVRDDLSQRVFEKLFVGESPRIANYAGRGALHAWLRAVVTREALAKLRKKKRETVDSDLLAAMPAAAPSEIAFAKKEWRDALKASFAEAFAALDARTRTVLRYKFSDGKSIDDIGLVYSVHRATVARWIQKGKDELFKDTARRLRERLSLSKDEFQDIIGELQSRLDFTIEWQLSGAGD